MRRAGRLFEPICEWENLRLATIKALRGKRSKGDARAFIADLETHLNAMRSDLLSATLRLGVYHQFIIHDPKKRLITAPCFRERVLHHAIMNGCEPIFENWLIDDTFACRKGRGRLSALERAAEFSRLYPFYLKMDIRKYFDSIRHPILLQRLEGLIKDRRLLDLFERILAGYSTAPEQGLPIGSLTSQHFANVYLGGLDRFVTEKLRARGYIRYMDDCVIWGGSPADLRNLLEDCRSFLGSELGLTVKDWPHINRTSAGINVLGCRVFPSHTILNRRSKLRFRRSLKLLEESCEAGRISESVLQERSTALVAFTRTRGVRSWRFRQAVLQELEVSSQRPPSG